MPDKIYEYIKTLRNNQVFFKPNPGNAGDSMINYSTYQVFEKAGLDYKIVSDSDDLTGKCVIYGGGGNFVSYYNDASGFVAKWHKAADRMIILPGTINSHNDLLQELGGNVDIICREEVSYDYVKKLARNANVLLMNDMAFSLDLQPFYEWKQGKSILAQDDIIRNMMWFLVQEKITGPKILNSFRTDNESSLIHIPPDNIDISKLLESPDMSRKSAEVVTFYLLHFLNLFSQVNTNRLHVCIAGCLLGKKVDFYPNSYYKNKAVFDFSIKRKHRTVSWKIPV